MARLEQSSRIDYLRSGQAAMVASERRGQWIAFVLSIVFGTFALISALFDKQTAAVAFVSGPALVGVVTAVLRSKRDRDRDSSN